MERWVVRGLGEAPMRGCIYCRDDIMSHGAWSSRPLLDADRAKRHVYKVEDDVDPREEAQS